MKHLDEGTLQAFMDGELGEEQREEVTAHVAGCEPCRTELAWLRAASGELHGALAHLDRPAPVARDYAVAWPRKAGPARRMLHALPRAAVFVLGFAAVASATIPGSPVRRWVEEVLAPAPQVATTAAPRPAERAAGPELETSAAVAAPVEAGVSIRPEDGAVSIRLRDASPELRIRAVLTDGERAGVFATGAAAEARFSTGPGRIEVVGAGPGELRVELPRSGAATVEVDGQPYLVKEGEQLRLSVPPVDSSATEVMFRVRR